MTAFFSENNLAGLDRRSQWWRTSCMKLCWWMSTNASVCQQVIRWLIDWHEASSASVCVCVLLVEARRNTVRTHEVFTWPLMAMESSVLVQPKRPDWHKHEQMQQQHHSKSKFLLAPRKVTSPHEETITWESIYSGRKCDADMGLFLGCRLFRWSSLVGLAFSPCADLVVLPTCSDDIRLHSNGLLMPSARTPRGIWLEPKFQHGPRPAGKRLAYS